MNLIVNSRWAFYNIAGSAGKLSLFSPQPLKSRDMEEFLEARVYLWTMY